MSQIPYDEFSLLQENVSEWHLEGPVPTVRRFFVAVEGLRQLSGLQWGDGEPELALLHGGAQNAHTFDTVALALRRPLIALDLPGHGHSDAGPYGASAVLSHAADVEWALVQLLSGPRPLVGMSLGGLTAIVVAAARPDLVRSLMLIDITPGVNAAKTHHITDFVNGPVSFGDFDELLARTVAHNPTRSLSSLRRGILHNAVQRPGGSWVWRHQQHPASSLVAPPVPDLWSVVSTLTMPVTLVRGMSEGSVVDDEDERELLRRLPGASVVHVPGAGHSVQGDAPLELAALIGQLCP